MTFATIILFVVAGTVAKADVKEPPYEPSGWKPSGAAFLLPTRNQAQLNNEQFPPLAPPPAFTQSDRPLSPSFQVPVSSTPNFTPSTRPLSSSARRPAPQPEESTERQFIPLFRVPASPRSDSPPSTRLPSPAEDYRLSVSDNRARTNSANQDNQPFVYKSGSVLSIGRPLQGLSQSDDQTLINQNQSPFPEQYFPLPDRVDGSAPLTDLSPPNDNVGYVANYSPNSSDDDLNQASFTESESSPFNNQPVSSVNNAYVSNRPAQEYGVPSLEGGSALQNTPRVFFVVLPVRKVTSTGAEDKQTQDLAPGFTGRLLTTTNQATRRFPR